MDEAALFAAFDAAKNVKEAKFEPSLPAYAVGIAKEVADHFIAYAQFLVDCKATKIAYRLDYVNTHRCGSECSRKIYCDAYAPCRTSGNLHICDIQRCVERRDESGETVCMFTGRKYGADLGLDLGDRSGSREQFSKVVEKKHTHTKKFGPKPRREKPKNGTKGRKLSKRTIERNQDPDVLYAKARKTILNLLRECPPEYIPKLFVHRLSRLCVEAWTPIHVNAERIYRAIVYRFEYHCLVVVYNMRDGYGAREIPLLPASPFLATVLPDMNRFEEFGIITSWHTKCARQFMVALQKLTDSEIIRLGDRLRPLWPGE